MSVELHAHQVEAVEKMRNGCVLYGGVGVGKTITSLGYYFTKVCGGELNQWGSMKTPKDVYVITTAKVRDGQGFELQAAKMGVHQLPALSTNGVKITVDSWNNLHKYVGIKDAFFIFDEQRVVGYGSWARAFIKVAKDNEWVLLSATPGDTWMDYIPVFIANGWYRNKTDFIDQHVIWTPRVKFPKVLRYQNVGVLVKYRNQVLVHMPYERHTKRHPVDVWCDYDHDKLDQVVKKKWHVYEDRPLRDVSELFSVMRKVVNSDSSRLRSVEQLLLKHPKLIVFYNFDYELEMLRTLVPPDQLASPESIEQMASKLNGRRTQPKISKPSGVHSGEGVPQTSASLSTSIGGIESTSDSAIDCIEGRNPTHQGTALGLVTKNLRRPTGSTPNESDIQDASSVDANSSDSSPRRKSSSTVPNDISQIDQPQQTTTLSDASAKIASKSSSTKCGSTTLSPTPAKTDNTAYTVAHPVTCDTNSAISTAVSANETTASSSEETGCLNKNLCATSEDSEPHAQSLQDAIIVDVNQRKSATLRHVKSSKHSVSSPSVAELSSDGPIISSDTSTLGKSSATVTKNSEPTFSVAEWNGHKHEDIPTTERWVYLVQYRAGAEGWNCIETDAVVFFSQTYSYRDWWQAHGRIDRLNTPFTDLYYYHLISRTAIDKAIRAALRTKKNFNERNLVLS